MAEQIKKGWLYTREDEKFAPNTLVENVYTRSGTPYDEQVRNYFEAVRRANATTEGETAAKLKEHTSKLENLQQQITNTQDDIEERLKHFQDIDDTGILYITDEAGHVIAYFDASGIHAVDIEIKSGMTLSQAESNISTLQTNLTEAQNQIKTIRDSLVNIDASERDKLYILDGMGATPEECNVIAYIDEYGIHAVNFLTDDTVDYITLVNNVANNFQAIIDLEKRHDERLDVEEATSFEHESRLDGLDISVKNLQDADLALDERLDVEEETSKSHGSRLDNLESDVKKLQDEDIALDKRLDKEETLSAEHELKINALQKKTEYQNVDHDKTLFIVDKNDKVIGYFDESGLHAVNILSGGSTQHPTVYDLNVELAALHKTDSDLNKAIEDEAAAREAADADLARDISQNEQDIAAIKDVFKHSEFDDAFYFTDSNKNVVAYVDKTGVHAVNIWFGSDTGTEAHGPIRDLISTIEALLLADSNINDMLSNHEGRIDELEIWRPEAENADVQLGKRIDKVAEDLATETSKRDIDDKAINKRIDNLDDKVDSEIERAKGVEEGLQTQISENKQNADTRISYLDRVANFYATKPTNPANGDLSLEGNNLVIYDNIDKVWKPFNGLSKQLKEKTQYLDAEFSDKFYIVDNNNNTVAYFDESGFHSINVFVGSTTGENHTDKVYDVYSEITILKAGLAAEISRSSQADAEHEAEDRALHGRIDSTNEALSNEEKARIDDVKALNDRVDVTDKNLSDEISRAKSAEGNLQTQISENANISATGISNLNKATNFYPTKPTNPVNGDLSLEGNNLVIYDGISKKWESFIGLSRQLKEKTQYFDGSSDDKFYITDNAGNVVAYFGADGFHAINMWIGSTIGENHTQNVYDVYTQITNLNSGLNSEISRSAQADEEHDKRLDTIEGRLENVSNVMDFVGVYQTTQERDKQNPNPNNGDVCVVRDVEGKGYDKEFVYANGAWQEIGDVSAEMARLDKLESIVGDPATNVAGTHEARLDGLDRALAQETSDREAGDSAINQTLTSMQNNFSWTDDNKRLYIIDGTADQNVLAVFYDNGLMIPDVVIKDIKNNKEKNLRSSASYLAPEKDITITWL